MDSKLRRVFLVVLQLCFMPVAVVVIADDSKTSSTSTEWKSLRIINGQFDLVELELVQQEIPIDPRHPHFDQKLIGKRIAPQFIELKYPIDKELGLSETQRQELISLYLELPAIERSTRDEFLTKEYEKIKKIARDKLETADNRSKAGEEAVKIHRDYMQRRASIVNGRLIEILAPLQVQRLNQLSRQLDLRQGWNHPSLQGLMDHLVPSCLHFDPRKLAEFTSIRESYQSTYTPINIASIYPTFTAEGKPIPELEEYFALIGSDTELVTVLNRQAKTLSLEQLEALPVALGKECIVPKEFFAFVEKLILEWRETRVVE